MRSYLLLHFSFLKPVFYTPSFPIPLILPRFISFHFTFCIFCFYMHNNSLHSFSLLIPFSYLYYYSSFSLTMYIHRVTIV